MHNGQSEGSEYCLLKGVFVVHGGPQLGCLLLYTQLIRSRLKDEVQAHNASSYIFL